MRRYDQDDSRAIGHMSPHNSVRFSDTFESESRNTMSASLPRWQVNDTVRLGYSDYLNNYSMCEYEKGSS